MQLEPEQQKVFYKCKHPIFRGEAVEMQANVCPDGRRSGGREMMGKSQVTTSGHLRLKVLQGWPQEKTRKMRWGEERGSQNV